jgi:CDP-glucose 4,6-dehydratase
MSQRDRDFYRGKRVLLTGHTGFKGAWLSLWLADCGAEVHGLALPPETEASLFDEARVAQRLATHTVGDVRDLEAVRKAIGAAKPEIVFHLAAQALVRRSYREPAETFATNVMGTVNVLEAVRLAGAGGARVCQIITTDKCYENREWVHPYRECDRLGGHDPYSASKACAELAVSSYRKSFLAGLGISLSSARAGNVIGGGDWAEDRIVPDAIAALSRGESVLVRNPHAIRPWQHVLEPLSGYLRLARRQWESPAECSEAYNFGPMPGEALSVGELAGEVVKAWGTGTWHSGEKNAGAPAPHEAHFLRLDITKAMSELSWRPRWDVRQGIRETVEWYRQRNSRQAFDAQESCLDQIRRYEQQGFAGREV